MFRFIFFLLVPCFFSFSSGAIYNLKSKKAGGPKKAEKKHWLLVAQGCHSCSETLADLTKLCSGKKPAPSQIGFFATGPNPKALLKKLKAFQAGYEIFSGSPNEFYEAYKIQGSPSLKIKGGKKSVMGKASILKFLKKDSAFCAKAASSH